MSTVNLIPQEFRLDGIRRKRKRLWTIAGVVMLLLCLGSITVKYAAYLNADRSYREANEKFQQLDKNISSLATAENQLLRWKSRLALQERLSAYPGANTIVEEVVRRCPELVWVQSMQLGPLVEEEEGGQAEMPNLPKMAQMFVLRNAALSGEPGQEGEKKEEKKPTDITESLFTLEIKGLTTKHQVVADLLQALRGTNMFADIQLTSTSRNDARPMVLEFSVKCILIPNNLMGDGMTTAAAEEIGHW